MIAKLIARRSARVRALYLAQVAEDLRLDREAEALRVRVNARRRVGADALAW